MKYQICTMTGDKKHRTCTATRIIKADSLKAAYNAAGIKDQDATPDAPAAVYVYPLATLDDGNSIMQLASYARRQYRRWCIRNNSAVMQALSVSSWDDEDDLQTAATAIVDTLADNPGATMCEAYWSAWRAVEAVRAKLYRISEAEYIPGGLWCNPLITRTVRATYPDLAALIRRAMVEAALTERQRDILTAYCDGDAPADTMAIIGISKGPYYQALYAAQYKTLAVAVELDGNDLPTFAAAGITHADVDAALEIYARRARRR